MVGLNCTFCLILVKALPVYSTKRLKGKMLNTGLVLDLILYSHIQGDRALPEVAWGPEPWESVGPKSGGVGHC